jgi:hypothetical protein
MYFSLETRKFNPCSGLRLKFTYTWPIILALATSLTGFTASEEVAYAFDNGCEINLDPNVQLILAIKERFFVVSWLIHR